MSGARLQKQVEIRELVKEGLCSSTRGLLSPAPRQGRRASKGNSPAGCGLCSRPPASRYPAQATRSDPHEEQRRPLMCSRRKWGFQGPRSSQPERGLSDTKASLRRAGSLKLGPLWCSAHRAAQAGRGSRVILSQILGEPAATGIHGAEEAVSTSLPCFCSDAVGLLSPSAPRHSSGSLLSGLLVYVHSKTVLAPPLQATLRPASPSSPPNLWTNSHIAPKSALRRIVPSLTSLCHPLDCWSTAALPQLLTPTPAGPSLQHRHPLWGWLALLMLPGSLGTDAQHQEAKKGPQLQSLQHKEDKPFCVQ